MTFTFLLLVVVVSALERSTPTPKDRALCDDYANKQEVAVDDVLRIGCRVVCYVATRLKVALIIPNDTPCTLANVPVGSCKDGECLMPDN